VDGAIVGRVTKKRTRSLAVTAAVATVAAVLPATVAGAAPAVPASLPDRGCAPSGAALSYSDALDKRTASGTTVGGLSDLAFDRRSNAWASTVDNHAADPARIWFFRDLARPRVAREPLVLKRPDGTPYDGTTADNEGLVVLPGGDYRVSSETEPSIRIFGRDGVQKASLDVPARFQVAPSGQATANATLEGLTITPSGRRVVAAMEGALSGDTDATLHRFLVYDVDRHGGWHLTEQVGYRAEAGRRIPEVLAYTDDSLVVMEASFTVATGNAVKLYAATGLGRAEDVSGVADLATAPASVLGKKLVADVVTCPTLGARAKQPQANPLLDNYEGMALTFGGTSKRNSVAGVTLISDDNFGATQITRLLNLALLLP
jgi:hypothetical protein